MFPYAKLLLKLRIAAWNPLNYFGLDRTQRKSVTQGAAILLAFVVLAAYLIWMEVLLFSAFVQLGEPETMLALVAATSTLLVIFTSFFYVLSDLFFSKDILFVSSLPIPSRQLLWAKLLRIWLGEAAIAMVICLPVEILYGIHAGMGALYYVSGAVLTVFVPMVPLAAVTLLSFVLIRISALWKNSEKLTVIASVLLLSAVIWFQLQWTSGANSGSMNGMMLQLVTNQRAMFSMFARIYPPAGWFCTALSAGGGSAVLSWLGFAALNLGCIGFAALALGGKYQQLAIRQSETLVRAVVTNRRAGRQAARTPFRALYRREIREIFMSPSYALNCLTTSFVLPILFAAAILGKGDSSNGLAALLPLLNTLPAFTVTGVFTALFAITGSMNMAAATSVSREGVRHEFFRTLPVSPQRLLLAKLGMGLSIGIIGTLPTAVMLVVMLPGLAPYALIGYAFALPLILCTQLAALMLDVSHPKFGWKSETEAIKQNGMAALSMFGGMGLVVACGFAFYGLSSLGVPPAVSYFAICGAALTADLLLMRRLNGKSAQTYLLKEVVL